MKFIKLIIYFSAWMVSYLMPLIIFMSESGTCTQGSTDEYLTSAVLSIIIMLIFIPAVHMLYKTFISCWWLSVFHITTIVSYLIVIPKYLFYTTVQGYSLCHGNKYWGGFNSGELSRSEYLAATTEDRMFAIVLTAATALIIIYIFKIICYRFKKGNKYASS